MEEQPRSYRVAFYRYITDNAGASTRSEIMTIVVTGAVSEHYAINVAKQQFERSRHVLNWTYLATDLDIQEVHSSAKRL
jgi:hypothetical protein